MIISDWDHPTLFEGFGIMAITLFVIFLGWCAYTEIRNSAIESVTTTKCKKCKGKGRVKK